MTPAEVMETAAWHAWWNSLCHDYQRDYNLVRTEPELGDQLGDLCARCLSATCPGGCKARVRVLCGVTRVSQFASTPGGVVACEEDRGHEGRHMGKAANCTWVSWEAIVPHGVEK